MDAPVSCTNDQHIRGNLKEVGDLAVWSVSSAKPGNGVELLRDGSTDTYWQSDGSQPHTVTVQFQRRIQLLELHLYLDYKGDESYTPQRILVRAGNSVHELKDLRQLELKEPQGWVAVPLAIEGAGAAAAAGGGAEEEDTAGAHEEPLSTFVLQVAVLSNHQSGRDTHVRLLEVYGPRAGEGGRHGLPTFHSPELQMYTTWR